VNGQRLLLRIWRDVPFPDWLRTIFLRILNPSFMIGASAVVQDSEGRVLLLKHTYRKHLDWGLPGGWLKRTESPEHGLEREVFEETGFTVRVTELLAAGSLEDSQLDLMYRCEFLGGTYVANEETSAARWVHVSELPELLPNQLFLLRKAGLLPPI
jgi:8-oxo-dGTP diphosphatase